MSYRVLVCSCVHFLSLSLENVLCDGQFYFYCFLYYIQSLCPFLFYFYCFLYYILSLCPFLFYFAVSHVISYPCVLSCSILQFSILSLRPLLFYSVFLCYILSLCTVFISHQIHHLPLISCPHVSLLMYPSVPVSSCPTCVSQYPCVPY